MSDEPVSLLVSGNLVDVDTGIVSESLTAMNDGRIVVPEKQPAARELDAEYTAPGLIDAHMRVESSMAALPQYVGAMVPRGATNVIHDPHEIANVGGVVDVGAMMADATRTSLKIRFTVSLSVPTATLQGGGTVLGAEAVDALSGEDKVVALGEVMNIPGVTAGDDSVHERIRATRDHRLTIDRHAPRVRGSDPQVVAQHLDNDHESVSLTEAREKVEVGLHIYPREDSASKNLADVVGLVDGVGSRRLSLCADDRGVVDLVEQGGADFAARKTIRLGVDPVGAMQMVTVNTAESHGLLSGWIRSGAPTDLVLLSDL